MDRIPSNEDLQKLIGKERFSAWGGVCSLVESLYNMETLWNTGGKKWEYEYKYRRGGKTLCALYAKKDCYDTSLINGIERLLRVKRKPNKKPS